MDDGKKILLNCSQKQHLYNILPFGYNTNGAATQQVPQMTYDNARACHKNKIKILESHVNDRRAHRQTATIVTNAVLGSNKQLRW